MVTLVSYYVQIPNMIYSFIQQALLIEKNDFIIENLIKVITSKYYLYLFKCDTITIML